MRPCVLRHLDSLSVGLAYKLSGIHQIGSSPTHRESVVVAARDLESERVLRAGDLSQVQLTKIGDNYVTEDLSKLTGWVLVHDIAPGEPIRFEDILRPQVVATQDLASGMVITPDAVSLAWKPYDPDAVDEVDKVACYKAKYPIQRSKVVLRNSISDTRAPQDTQCN
jgi:Flp pilus assembly protein CpaB